MLITKVIGKPLHFPAELRVLISIESIEFLVFKSIPDFEFHFTLFIGAFLGYKAKNICF